MDERAQAFYDRVKKYGGWQEVAIPTIHSVFEEILKPSQLGFALAKRGWWARPVNDGILQVIRLDALKGRSYGLSYGLCLSYVPYPYAPRLRWHRTTKSIMLHLREQPQVHLQDPVRPKSEAELCVVDTTLGERCLREELKQGWTFCSEKIHRWFEATSTLTGILERCREHLDRPRNEVQYVPGVRLVRAFTYAKLGRDNARTELEIFIDENGEGENARINLRTALEKVLLS